MKSKAQFRSHPIHPILVSFPIAFFIGSFVFDLLGFFLEPVPFQQIADYLIPSGILTGLLAAIPGVVDYSATIPPKSSAKQRAVKHALLNGTVIILFTISHFRRDSPMAFHWILLLELAAVVLLFISGFLGGTLVYRNQIGVDIRYANAGKWRETHASIRDGRIEAGSTEELGVNQMKLIWVNDYRLVLGRTEEGFVAFSDRCPHRGGSLAGGAMICGKVQCPWHGSQFDLRTGKADAGPAKDGIAVYPTLIENGKVFILIK